MSDSEAPALFNSDPPPTMPDPNFLDLWRIVPGNDPLRAMSGSGGMTSSGRWHTKGRLVVYLASTPSLAMLEVLVNVDSNFLYSHDYHLMGVRIPRNAADILNHSGLPAHWNQAARVPQTAGIGDDWLASTRQLALRVPSAVVPLDVSALEHNYLINPVHPRWNERVVSRPLPLPFDVRFKRGRTD